VRSRVMSSEEREGLLKTKKKDRIELTGTAFAVVKADFDSKETSAIADDEFSEMRKRQRVPTVYEHEFAFVLLSAATIAMLGLSCVAEEYIIKQIPGFDFFWFLAFSELVVFSLFTWLVTKFGFDFDGQTEDERRIQREKQSDEDFVRSNSGHNDNNNSGTDNNNSNSSSNNRRSCSIDTKAPKHYLVWGGILIALYTSLGKFAYKYVNYATGTVLKSAKLIPVMFVSVIWLKRRYAFIDYVACVLLVAAACEFGFAEQEGQEETKNESENYALGVTLSVITIAIGAVQSNVTDRILRDYGASVAENMLWTNAVGAVFVFFLVVTIEPHAFMFFWQTPFYFMLLTFRSVSFFFGAWLYTIIVKYFGAVPAVAITTTRKLLTVIGSFIFFSSDKPFSTTYAIALALFIAAVACEFVKHVQKHGNPCSFRKASPLPK